MEIRAFEDGPGFADISSGDRQVIDVYLLGLARRRGGRLATFDRSIPLGAVVGVGPEHLEIIPA